jgi:hypothetical protein
MTDPKSTPRPMTPAADDAELFGPGWLTTHLDALMDELAARPPEFWPRLTGSRAEAQAGIDAELRRRREAI